MDWIWWTDDGTNLEQDFSDPSAARDSGKWVQSAVNALIEEPEAIEADLASAGRGGTVVCWGGWASGQPAEPASGQFEPSPEVWLPAGRARVEAFFAGVAERAQAAGVSVLVRPHAATGLSDLPGCVAFHRTFGDRLGLVAEPAGLLTPETLATQDELIGRAGQVFEALSCVGAVGLFGGVSSGDASSGLAPCAITEGAVDRALLLAALAPLLSRGLPMIAPDSDRGVQQAAVHESLPHGSIR